MVTTIITDCQDANATGRSIARSVALLNQPTHLVGVNSDLEAAGNLIDIIDATDGATGIILVNVAPRHADAKKWPNGTPFGYFYYQNILVVSTIDGLALSLVKKYNLTKEIKVVDIPKATEIMSRDNYIPDHLPDHISNSQFRSYDFLPRLAGYLIKHQEIAHEVLPINQIPDAPKAIWWVDNFGNCKTTLWAEELADILKNHPAEKLPTKYSGLKDVPDHEPALIVGSSGLDSRRFVEIVVQGQSASHKYNLKSGDNIHIIAEKLLK